MEDLEYIKKLVTVYYKVDIDNKLREREIVSARQVSHYLAKRHTKRSLSVIGMKLGGMNHATVLYGDKVVKDLLTYDKKLNEDLIYLDDKLRTKLNTLPKYKRETSFFNEIENYDISLSIHYKGYNQIVHSSIKSNYIRLFNRPITTFHA